MPLYVPASGLLQSGALNQSRSLLIVLLIVVLVQVTVGGVIAIPAVPDVATLLQESTEAIVNVPQLAVLLLPPQLAVADTLYVENVEAAGLFQFGAFVQVMLVVTVLVPHLTVGGVIAVPATPVVGIPVQVSWSASGAELTVNVPLQVADLPLQFPELADTDMPLYVPITGLFQFGAFVQLRPFLTDIPLQVTIGGVIVAPTMPVEGTAAQVSVYAAEPEPLLELPPLSPPPSPPDEQEKVNAKASPKAAKNAILENRVLIVCSPFCV